MTTTYFHHRRVPHPRARRGHGGLPALPLMAICALSVGALGFVGFVLWPRWPEPPIAPDAPSLPITVGGTVFNLPPAAIRVPMQRQPGTHARVDLTFLWPSLEPPDPANASGASKPLPNLSQRLFVTIVAAGGTLAPLDRLKTIYPRYAMRDPVAGPDGLAVLPFRDGSPYHGEDLIYDGTTPGKFLVRCSRNGAGPVPGICLYSRRIEGADVTVRFPRDWLNDWRAVAGGVDTLIARLHPGAEATAR
jgi:hypothetical protein